MSKCVFYRFENIQIKSYGENVKANKQAPRPGPVSGQQKQTLQTWGLETWKVPCVVCDWDSNVGPPLRTNPVEFQVVVRVGG